MEAPTTRPLSQVWKDVKSMLSKPSKPIFIAECDYQVESGNMGVGGLPQPPPSPALSFEQLSEDYSQGAINYESDVAPATFTCFKNLPAEIRLLIWGMACGQQRNVNIGFRTWAIHGRLFTYISNTPGPNVLSVCKESREEGLKYYSPSFGTSFKSVRYDFEARPMIPCNFKTDTICLDLNFKHVGICQPYKDLLREVNTTPMSSIAFNIDQFISYNPRQGDFDIKWTQIFRIVDAYEGRTSVLQEIVLYYDAQEKPKIHGVVTEFVELDWCAMDPDCQKMKQLQSVQRDLLRELPRWREVSPSPESENESESSSSRKLWANIQSKVKLMDLKVNYR